jgi:pantoate--beta-alanine ligase
MGALHDGHRALLRRARIEAANVAVSIFVNPLQFGPNEDLDRYPRTLDADLEACRAEGVGLVFVPDVPTMYPTQPVVRLNAGPMGEVLEGASRPGHFDGVLTVVLKLFHLVRPDIAVFGAKDAQQLVLVRRMVDDLDVGVRIVAEATVREPDGLALSSRNRYLSADERSSALALPQALRVGEEAAKRGVKAVRDCTNAVLARESGVRTDYVTLVDPRTFTEVPDNYAGPAVLAIAAYVGSTRLIDNATLELP